MIFDQAITYPATGDIGNPLTYRGYNLTWKYGRQLYSMVGNGKTLSFKYDDNGIRTQKSVNGVATNYHTVGGKVTYEKTGTQGVYYYYDGAGKLFSMRIDNTFYYYLKNAQGDITGLIDNNGTRVVSYTYDAWGKLLSTTGTLASTIGQINPFRCRGYYYDKETGLFYVGSRYYDPEIGRWLSPEPNVDAGEFDEGAGLLAYNVYAYCANNPVNFYDPSGEAILTCILVGAGIGLLAGGLFGAYRASKNGYTPSDGWRYWKYVVGYGVVGGTVGALIGWGAGVLIPKFGAVMAAKSITSGGGVGYATFQQLKNSLGSPGWGKQWHHIVEQCQSVKSGFSTFWINNSNNVINITKQVHQKVNAHYSSIQSYTNGLRVRDWLADQSFEKQYEYGVKILRQLGVKI